MSFNQIMGIIFTIAIYFFFSQIIRYLFLRARNLGKAELKDGQMTKANKFIGIGPGNKIVLYIFFILLIVLIAEFLNIPFYFLGEPEKMNILDQKEIISPDDVIV